MVEGVKNGTMFSSGLVGKIGKTGGESFGGNMLAFLSF